MSGNRERPAPRKRLLDRVTGRDTRDRLVSLERIVRKLAEAHRDDAIGLGSRIDELSESVALKARAKDVHEVLDAVRALGSQLERTIDDQLAHGGSAEQQRLAERRLIRRFDAVSAATGPIVIGPWTGEVGFELLYWVPFVRWAVERWNLAGDRCVIVSRGGVADWYGLTGSRYVDIFSLASPDRFREGVDQHEHKQRRPGAFDQELLEAAGLASLPSASHVHPELMYRMFMPYWRDEAGLIDVDRFARYRRMAPPRDPIADALPPDYVAVRFYFSDSFPRTEENQAFARATVAALSSRLPVVLLNPDLRIDDHTDLRLAGDRIISIADGLAPERNLAVQSAVIARARAFVGTYGGYSYLAPFYGVPALAFYSSRSFKLHHLHTAQRVFERLGTADVLPIDVGHAALVQLAVSAVVDAVPR